MRLIRPHYVFIPFLCVLFLPFLETLAVGPLDEGLLYNSLDTLIDNHATAERTTVTLKVVDLKTGEVLYDRGGDKLLVPASNLKIYTAAAALDLLGPGYQWATEIIADGSVRRGICSGDLLINGFGDPMLDTKQLERIADTLVTTHKLKRVRGNVRVATQFRWRDVPLKGPGWMWDDEPDYYNMSIRQVMLNFNTLNVTVEPGASGAQVALDPASNWPNVVIETNPAGDATPVQITRRPFESMIRVSGNLEPGDEPVSEKITMHNPSPWIASVFKHMLVKRGVTFSHTNEEDSAETYYIGADENSLVSQDGQTLAEALRHFLKVSENAVGEMVLLKLAETQTDEDVSWPVGAKVISDWLVDNAGLEDGSFRLVDGSGLSRYNLISADSSVKLLAFMKTHEHYEPFFDGLPVYKVELSKSEGEGEKWGGVPLAEFEAERVFAKTGGMASVSTISGYIKTLDGRWLAFSLLSNGYIGSNKPVKDLRNQIWTELVRYRAVEAGVLTPDSP